MEKGGRMEGERKMNEGKGKRRGVEGRVKGYGEGREVRGEEGEGI